MRSATILFFFFQTLEQSRDPIDFYRLYRPSCLLFIYVILYISHAARTRLTFRVAESLSATRNRTRVTRVTTLELRKRVTLDR